MKNNEYGDVNIDEDMGSMGKSMGWIEAFQKFYQLIPVRTCTEKHIGYIGVLACGTFSCTNTLGIEY